MSQMFERVFHIRIFSAHGFSFQNHIGQSCFYVSVFRLMSNKIEVFAVSFRRKLAVSSFISSFPNIVMQFPLKAVTLRSFKFL